MKPKILPALVLALAVSTPSFAQAPPASSSTGSGSPGCSAIVQAGSNGAQTRINLDDQFVNPPMSVTKLSCLGNFFNGTGLNVITSLLNPSTLLQAVEGQICQAVSQEWKSLLGSVQCGLTLTGFNLGFGSGLGSGSLCPKLSFGGGGPPIGSIGVGLSGNSSFYTSGQGVAPRGYTLPVTGGLW
jgi:hypothetical protein